MLREASKAGDSEAQFRLASLKLHRGGIERDGLEYDEEGMALLRKAAGAGHTEAKVMLAACIAEFREAGGAPLNHTEYSVLHTCIQLHGACIPCSTPNDPKCLTNGTWHLTPRPPQVNSANSPHLTPHAPCLIPHSPHKHRPCHLPHTLHHTPSTSHSASETVKSKLMHHKGYFIPLVHELRP
jgi:TPR repeat protein